MMSMVILEERMILPILGNLSKNVPALLENLQKIINTKTLNKKLLVLSTKNSSSDIV